MPYIERLHFSAIATAAQHRARQRTSITSDVWWETKRRCTRHPQLFRPSPCRWLRRICISLAGFASVNGMQKRPGLEGALVVRRMLAYENNRTNIWPCYCICGYPWPTYYTNMRISMAYLYIK